MKRTVVEAATPILVGTRLHDFSKPIRHPEYPALQVLLVREMIDVEGPSLNQLRDIVVVKGHNYWWKFIPMLEEGRVDSFRIQASPICLG